MADEHLVDQPGLAPLRGTLETAKRRAPSGSTVVREGAAGLTVAVGSVPDGMANGLLAGVNPVYGLYANIVAPIVGGLTSNSRLMVINSTSAGAIVAGQALAGSSGGGGEALFLLIIVSGIAQLAFGLLGLGRLIRFVSYSVMTGFVSGLAVVLALSQLPTVTGVDVPEGSTLADTVAVLTNLGDVDLTTLGVAALAVVLAVVLSRTRISKVAALVAIVVPTVVVAVLALDVGLVDDIGEIPTGLPAPYLPSPSDLSVEVVTGALSLALVVLVQGAGVSQSVSSSQGERGSISRDFTAQGAANIAAGMASGLPVGGSFKGTTLNASAGGQQRWSAIFSGLWMLLIVLAFSRLVSQVAMPALGGLLVYVSAGTLQPANIRSVWRSGDHARLAAAITFVATVALPIQVAVLIGVVLAAFLYVSESSTDISVVELVEHDDGSVEERERPSRLRGDDITVVDVYGPLFYAGARRLEQLLPDVGDAHRPALVIRLRGRSRLGATVIDVLSQYAEEIRSAGGRLYLTGVDPEARTRLLRHVALGPGSGVRIYEAAPTVGESTRQAIREARTWLDDPHDDPS